MTSLSADALIAEAEETVGVSDSDGFVRRNLERLVPALAEEGGLSRDGEDSARRMLLMDTVNRLEGLKYLGEFPEIEDEVIEAPVFLMGLPRSGTTLFQYLFDLDERFRQLRTWEALTPSPPQGADPAAAESRRGEWAKRRREALPEVPGFEAMHLHDEDGSEECHAFLEQSFGAAGLNNIYRVPSYFDYLLDEADLEASYRVHRRQLQLLQWRMPACRWSLKYPNHVLATEAIAAVYPDASLVMTHRDPVQTLASIANLTARFRAVRMQDPVDLADVGRDMLHFVSRHIDRIMAAVNASRSRPIVHVDYYALVRDPVAVMTRVHTELGLETPPALRQAVADWHRANPRHARGKNEYALEDYGLVDGEVAERFEAYRRHFNIPRESEAA